MNTMSFVFHMLRWFSLIINTGWLSGSLKIISLQRLNKFAERKHPCHISLSIFCMLAQFVFFPYVSLLLIADLHGFLTLLFVIIVVVKVASIIVILS